MQEQVQGGAEAGGGDDQIIDQIGLLMQKLAPEKQLQVIQKLAELAQGGAEEPQPAPTMSPEGGPNGKPVGF